MIRVGSFQNNTAYFPQQVEFAQEIQEALIQIKEGKLTEVTASFDTIPYPKKGEEDKKRKALLNAIAFEISQSYKHPEEAIVSKLIDDNQLKAACEFVKSLSQLGYAIEGYTQTYYDLNASITLVIKAYYQKSLTLDIASFITFLSEPGKSHAIKEFSFLHKGTYEKSVTIFINALIDLKYSETDFIHLTKDLSENDQREALHVFLDHQQLQSRPELSEHAPLIQGGPRSSSGQSCGGYNCGEECNFVRDDGYRNRRFSLLMIQGVVSLSIITGTISNTLRVMDNEGNCDERGKFYPTIVGASLAIASISQLIINRIIRNRPSLGRLRGTYRCITDICVPLSSVSFGMNLFTILMSAGCYEGDPRYYGN